MAANADSKATINLKGGKLIIGGQVQKFNNLAVAPVVGLTGGTLEFNNTTTPNAQTLANGLNQQWQQIGS